ncbi:MAG TPA: hypothetical protein VF992_10800 [Thermoplasmata archaeon]
MARLLEEWAEDVDKQIRKLASYGAEEQLRLISAISAHFLRIRALVDALSRGLVTSNRVIHELLEESIIEISGAALIRDIVVVDSPLETRSLESKLDVSSDEVSFVLFVKPGVGYDKLPLLPRVVHEAAHCDFEIRNLVADSSIRVRWLGEACCDLVALCLAGPCFLMSTRALVELVGPEAARLPDRRHPSLAMRISILKAVSDQIWPGGRVHAFALAELGRVSTVVCRPEDLEDQRRLERQVLEALPRYSRLSRDPQLWQDIYQGRTSDRTRSALLSMNYQAAEGFEKP